MNVSDLFLFQMKVKLKWTKNHSTRIQTWQQKSKWREISNSRSTLRDKWTLYYLMRIKLRSICYLITNYKFTRDIKWLLVYYINGIPKIRNLFRITTKAQFVSAALPNCGLIYSRNVKWMIAQRYISSIVFMIAMH